MRVLVVEDEENIARALEIGLRSEGFEVEVERTGDAGLWRAQEGTFDAIILDLMLPRMNGYKICAQLRSEGDRTPILMLTAKDGDYDQIEGFETGADDYVTKPFSFPILVARVRALVRRGVLQFSGSSGAPQGTQRSRKRWSSRPTAWYDLELLPLRSEDVG